MPGQGFTHLPIGPWSGGMVNTTRATRIPPSGLKDAINVNIRPDGTLYSRNTWTSVLDDVVGRDLFEHGGRVFCVLDNDLAELDATGANVMLPSVGRVNWTVLNDTPVFCTQDAVYEIGTHVTMLSGVTPDGQDLDDVLVPLPGGQWVDYWQGRLVVARGARLLFSQPLRYGAHNPLTDYRQMPGRIEWVAPLPTGIFIGLRGQVVWLEGNNPDVFVQKRVAGRSAPGMALTVDSEHMHSELAAGGQVAVFLTPHGFALGHETGAIEYPQKAALKELPLFRGKLIREGSRIYAVRGM